jgi:transposase InsO family protein
MLCENSMPVTERGANTAAALGHEKGGLDFQGTRGPYLVATGIELSGFDAGLEPQIPAAARAHPACVDPSPRRQESLPMGNVPKIALPPDWSEHVRSAMVCAVGLAHFALTHARAWAADSRLGRVRLAAERDIARSEVGLLDWELRLLRARFERVPPKHRPQYLPEERFEVVELGAARRWNNAELARHMVIAPSTVGDWRTRVDEHGKQALLELREVVNRFPDFVAQLVQSLKALAPLMGRVRIADLLARAGLHLSASTVRRLLERPVPKPPPTGPVKSGKIEKGEKASGRTVTARYPGHVWNCDLTTMALGGFFVPWFPFTVPTFWPFCWHIAVVVEHFSRKVLGVAVFKKEPTSAQVCALLSRCSRERGPPKYIVTDQGTQFGKRCRKWCKKNGVKPRFGAVGKSGSIALIERYLGSLKREALRLVEIPFRRAQMLEEVAAYAGWFNEHRPHRALDGLTPNEVFDARAPARARARLEPRPRYPLGRAPSRCAPKKICGKRGVQLRLVVERFQGRKHLPIVSLELAA